MSEFPFKNPKNTMCFTCEHILNKEKPILYVNHDAQLNMWEFLCGDKHEISQGRIVSLYEIYILDNTITEVSNLKRNSKACRQSPDCKWSITESKLDFGNITVVNYTDIVDISSKGITYKSSNGNKLIDFKVCSSNYAAEYNLENIKCVATRDITGSYPCFDFYTNPITRVVLAKNNKFKEFIKKHNTISLFHKLQMKIISLGYDTYDLS